MQDIDGFWYESTIGGLIREIRPWQWYKQFVMFLALIFSQNLLNFDAWTSLLLGVFSFSALAGANYIFNDISDLQEDRKHPKKKNRPIAKGQVGVTLAIFYGIVLLSMSLYVSYVIGLEFTAVLMVYFALNTVYSAYLKNIAFLDVILISIFFVLRAIAGVIAVGVRLSPWLIFTVFLSALMIAIAKRREEYLNRENPAGSRPALRHYSDDILERMFTLVSTSLIVSYSLYSFFGADIWMMITLPFAYYAIFRYWYLVEHKSVGENPYKILLDRQMLSSLVLWSFLSVAIVYNSYVKIGGFLP